MKRRIFLLILTMLLSAQARATPAEIETVLEDQRQHGFASPALAIEQLTRVNDGLAEAPLDLRMRYHAALAALYIGSEQRDLLKGELAELEKMATTEKCAPCAHYKLVRELQLANRMQDVTTGNALLARLETVKATEPNLRQAIAFVKAGGFESAGHHARAIDAAIEASQLASAAGNPAEHVRALNMLMLANIGRRDLPRAEALSHEAYAIAERIGFVYMMSYIRVNQGWIYSLTGEPQKQLHALTEALAITRAHPGLVDAELINLVNLAEYHVGQKNYKQGAELAMQAVALAERQKKATAKGVALMSLGQAQMALGEPDKGIATMQQSIAVLTETGATGYLIDATEALAQVYETGGRHREALATLRKFIALKQTATLAEREKAIAEAQEKFSGERKDLEIQRLSLENARRQAEVNARAWQQRLWAVAALALALGGVLLIQLVSRTRRRNRQLEDSNAVLSDQSVHDPLTGAFNRRHCVALMDQQAALQASRSRDRSYSASVGLVLLDVDHFKHINDTYGHAAGDTVLVEMARRLQALVRQHDVVVRWGGEEFVLVLPGTSPEGMTVLAERALGVIAETPVMVEGRAVPVTVSLGCVSFPLLPGLPWQDSLKVADLAMYQAKQRGRNRAVCVMGINTAAAPDISLADLAAAEAAGQVELRVIEGPAT
jgi:diguanylate cyclase (GGDEF)-like protein